MVANPPPTRHRRPACLALAAVCCVLALSLISVRVLAAEIWLCGPAPPTFMTAQDRQNSDFQALFQPDAPWSRAASAVRVFKVYSRFILYASDDELRTAFADLRRRNIALALEAPVMTADDHCGRRTEGFAPATTVARMAERIRDTGGDLQYLAMDEPLFFGHQYDGANACHKPIEDIARDVAGNIAAVKQVFPAVLVGDIEPFGMAEPADWLDQTMQWAQAYRDATGDPLAFLDVDVVWTGRWRSQLPPLAARLQAASIKFGVIYDGDPSDPTGVAWTSHAEQRFVAVESDLGLTPDQAILQTWQPHPRHMLPETEPGTMTWLVDRYLAQPTRLTFYHADGRLEGTLTDAAGHPIARAPVALSAETLGETGPLAVHTSAGQVPPNAVEALLALRINTACNCSGPADVAIGAMRYRDDRGSQTVELAFRSPTMPGALPVRFRALPGQPATQNTSTFPVVPDDPFSIEVPMRTDPASANSGYVALIFLDAQRHEVLRVRLPFSAAVTPIGQVTTDARGRFAFPLGAEDQRVASGFSAEFAGTRKYRMIDADVN